MNTGQADLLLARHVIMEHAAALDIFVTHTAKKLAEGMPRIRLMAVLLDATSETYRCDADLAGIFAQAIVRLAELKEPF